MFLRRKNAQMSCYGNFTIRKCRRALNRAFPAVRYADYISKRRRLTNVLRTARFRGEPVLNVAAERVQGRHYGGPAAGGGICEDVQGMNYARARILCCIYTWNYLARSTQRCDMHACDKISHFQLPPPAKRRRARVLAPGPAHPAQGPVLRGHLPLPKTPIRA